MRPCDKYQGQVITESGLTPADPTGWLTTVQDYAEWKRLAQKLLTILADAIERHQADLGASEWPAAYEQLQARVNGAPQVYEILGIETAPSATDADLHRMKDVAVEAACLIGEVEAEVEEYDAPLPNPPEDEDGFFGKTLDKVSGTATTLLVVYLAYRYFEGRK